MRQTVPYSNISKRCLLCLNEKLAITLYPTSEELLNMKSEMISKCHLLNKFLSMNFNSYDRAIDLFPSVLLSQIILVFQLFNLNKGVTPQLILYNSQQMEIISLMSILMPIMMLRMLKSNLDFMGNDIFLFLKKCIIVTVIVLYLIILSKYIF